MSDGACENSLLASASGGQSGVSHPSSQAPLRMALAQEPLLPPASCPSRVAVCSELLAQSPAPLPPLPAPLTIFKLCGLNELPATTSLHHSPFSLTDLRQLLWALSPDSCPATWEAGDQLLPIWTQTQLARPTLSTPHVFAGQGEPADSRLLESSPSSLCYPSVSFLPSHPLPGPPLCPILPSGTSGQGSCRIQVLG